MNAPAHSAAIESAAANARNTPDAVSADDTGTTGDADGNSRQQADSGKAQGERPRSSRGSRGSRGRSGGRGARPEQAEKTAAETPVALTDISEEPADFPMGFGDSGPEDFFASLEENDEESGTQEKRRRSRSRRGRGRKKNGDAAGSDSDTAPELDVDDEMDDEEDDASRPEPQAGKAGKTARRKMFVSVLPEEQIEVVITEEGQVQEYYVEMLHQAKTKGNIYKGIVHNVDANLQAAFVSYGAVKNGFLQIDEIHPEYYVAPHDSTKNRKYPPIQKVLRPGQEVLVQIVKEPAGTKGAFLTTYLSMPGRFLVLTPGREQIGVSRKVDNEAERSRLRELLEGLTPGPGLGVIVRTVSMGASKTSLQKDLQQLKRVWKEVRAKGLEEKAPCLVYQEMDLTSRAVRDYLTDAIVEVWIDDEPTANAVTEIASILFPRKQNLVRVHQDTTMTLFERFNVQRQLDQIHSREVVLPSGGRLVIDPTEALTAIDINSGRSGGKNNFEDMAYRTNMEAARMIPLQLRLRDIGGQVVADFIEMRDKAHWREVEKTLRNGMKVDRARYDVGKIGPFGLLEIVRQRLGSSAISISTEPCPCCGGTGMRRNMEWQSQSAMRDILRILRNAQAQKESTAAYTAEQPLALHLLNNKRQRLLEMEQLYGVKLTINIRQTEPQ
ncbi:Rne/Rng family ribonuclease [Desulfovibrio sp. OttesenSCG-928-G15]|nr:Rne/Rng family ribonuclease [Desulfovibrio sp. OttesenSCG-928-G15]